MGSEFGQRQEWNYAKGLEWMALESSLHLGAKRLMQDLNTVYKTEPALYELDFEWNGFQWIDANDSDNSVLSFIRFAKNPNDFLIIICNFTPVVRTDYRVGVPNLGKYVEIINSDLKIYGGSDVCNSGELHSIPEQCHNMDNSLILQLPPLSTIILKPC